MSEIAPPTLSQFLELSKLAELRSLYAERGFEGDDEALVAHAQKDWHEISKAAAKEALAPERFEPVVVEYQGIRINIYGVAHGILGGNDSTYKEFVNAGVRDLEHTIFENGMQYLYPSKKWVVIPDYLILGPLGSLAVGFIVGLNFHSLVWEMVGEMFKREQDYGEEIGNYDVRYHGVDPDVRRGLDPDYPTLPARVQMDYEMRAWEAGLSSRLKNSFAIVPRSICMAGYAVGYAQSRGLNETHVVVGDLHTMEMVRFLESGESHQIFEDAQRFAARSDLARGFIFLLVWLRHFSMAGIAGTIILVPILALLLYLLDMYL